MSRFLQSSARRTLAALAVALPALMVPASSPAGVVTAYNVNQAFVDNEANANPTTVNGPYTYGYSFVTNVGGTPLQFGPISSDGLQHTTAFAGTTGLQGFYYPNDAVVPAVVANVTGQTVTTTYSGGLPVQPGQLLLHPGSPTSSAYGNPAAYADVRYTVPTGGDSQYSISGFFSLIDSGGTDVHVAINGVSVFDKPINTGSSQQDFNLSVFLTAGSTVDFLVGPGGNGIGSDSTGLFANVVATPEPATFGPLALAGVIGLGYARRRRAVLARN